MATGYEFCLIDAVTKEPILKDRDELIEIYNPLCGRDLIDLMDAAEYWKEHKEGK